MVFKNSLHPCALDEISLSIGMVNGIYVIVYSFENIMKLEIIFMIN